MNSTIELVSSAPPTNHTIARTKLDAHRSYPRRHLHWVRCPSITPSPSPALSTMTTDHTLIHTELQVHRSHPRPHPHWARCPPITPSPTPYPPLTHTEFDAHPSHRRPQPHAARCPAITFSPSPACNSMSIAFYPISISRYFISSLFISYPYLSFHPFFSHIYLHIFLFILRMWGVCGADG